MNPLLKHHYENIATDNAVTNEDGSLSTVKSSIVNINGKEMLIPTVWGGEILDGDRLNEAIDNAFDSNIEWPTEEGKDAVNKLRSLEVDLHKQMRPVTRKNAANELIQDADKNRTLEQRYAPIKKGVLDTSYGPIELKEINKEDLLNTNEESDKNSNSSNTNFLKEMQEKFSIGNFNVIPKLEGAEKGVNFKLEYAKGGKIMATPSEEQQMEMMLDGGGFNDQGGTVDPVSGNEVPIGNTQEGVRDDVPIMASEREYVVDAATVNYFGVQKYNDEKKAAAVGYQQMEQDGLLGQPTQGAMLDSSEEMPFSIEDLDVADAEGQPVMMANGGVVPKGFYHGGYHYNPVPVGTDEMGRPIQATSSSRSLNVNQPNRPQPKSFNDAFPTTDEEYMTTKYYKHPDGRNIPIIFIRGVPMQSIPEGFVEYNPLDPSATTPTPVVDPAVKPAEVVKPFEYGGEVDQFGDPVGSNAGIQGSIDSAIDLGNLATGGRKSNAFESFVMDSTAYQNYMTKTLKDAGKIVPQDKIEKTRQFAMLNLQKEMTKHKTGTPAYNELADGLANTREYTKDKDGNTVPSDQHPSRKTSIPTTSSYYNRPTVNSPVPQVVKDEDYNELDPNVQNPNVVAPTPEDFNEFTGIGFEPDQSSTPTYSASSPATGGFTGYSGNAGPAGGGAPSSDAGTGGTGGYGMFNQGGLAGKKPKKKMKTYKKGGLATSKK